VRVVRVYHSAVVGAWRERDRRLRARGVDLTLVSPRRWNEGGAVVSFVAGTDEFAVPARTIGRHPYGFVYDPRPIWRALRAGPLDAHEEPASLAAAELLFLRRLAGRRQAKLLFYGAQNIAKRFPPPFRWIERAALRSAAGAYCCNRAAGEIFRIKGFRGEMRVIGLGVDVERFAPRAGERPPGPFRVGYVGRLEARKGVHVVIAALAALVANPTGAPEVELEVHGSGPHEATLRDLVAAHGLHRRVRFHGYCAHDHLPDVYRRLDVVVVPSQTTPAWVEQFGRVAVEAMASGVPVVVSASGALPEVVADAGVVVPEADVEAWAAAIRSLAEHPDETRRRAILGTARARDFSWESVAAEHAALYEEVLR
jgi:glycosyltransferase involved in cell wall biosynthesis